MNMKNGIHLANTEIIAVPNKRFVLNNGKETVDDPTKCLGIYPVMLIIPTSHFFRFLTSPPTPTQHNYNGQPACEPTYFTFSFVKMNELLMLLSRTRSSTFASHPCSPSPRHRSSSSLL